MAKLFYTAITSLDGYIEDESGKFDWSVPDEEVHAFVNDQERPIGTYLYGRRLYETMRAWETLNTEEQSAAVRDYAEIWRAADKIVFSSTLDDVSSERTRIERHFDLTIVTQLKRHALRDASIGGAELAGAALRAGLVDEVRLLVSPVLVGGGKRALPAQLRAKLELLAEHRFGNGVVYLRYGTLAG